MFLVLIFCALAAISSQVTASAYNLTFGQTAPLTGPTASLGIGYRDGIKIAFDRFNKIDGKPFGFTIDLNTKDDQYEPAPAYINAHSFFNTSEQSTFALLGGVGTPSASILMNITKNYGNVPMIGQMSGGGFLRASATAFPYHVINIRPSLLDEAAAMVYYLLSVRTDISRISVFLQDDAFGSTGLLGVTNALKENLLKVHTKGTFVRNTENVEQGLADIMKGSPQAICLFGTYGPLAKFVHLAKQVNPNLVFLTVTFVEPHAFLDRLLALGGSATASNVIVIQDVPLYSDKKDTLISTFEQDMASFNNSLKPNFVNLEGYIVGRFVGSVLHRMLSLGTSITRSNFLKTIYDQGIFQVDTLRMGPYGSESCTLYASGCRCNHGLHKLWITRINGTGEYELVPNTDFQFFSCGVAYKYPKTVKLSMVADMNKARNLDYERGLTMAFNGATERARLRGMEIVLNTYNDFGNVSKSHEIVTKYLLAPATRPVALVMPDWDSLDIFAKVINDGKLPIINPSKKSLNYPAVVRLVPTEIDEVQALFLYSKYVLKASRWLALITSDTDGKFSESDQIEAIDSIQSSFGITVPIARDASSIEIPSLTGIIILGGAGYARDAIELLSQKYLKSCVFMVHSDTNAASAFANFTDTVKERIYAVDSIPFFNDKDLNIVKQFEEDGIRTYSPLKASQNTFQGYVTGRFIVEILQRAAKVEDALQFLNALYQTKVINLEEVRFAGFQSNNYLTNETAFMESGYISNSGIESLRISNMASPEKYQTLSSGSEIRPLYRGDAAIKIIFLIISAVGVLLSFASSIWVLSNKEKPAVKGSDPFLLLNVMTGAMMEFIAVLLGSISKTQSTCIATDFLRNVAFFLIFTSMAVKAYRVSVIFNAKTRTLSTSDFVSSPRKLYATVFVMVLLVTVYMIVWGVLSPPDLQFIVYTGSNAPVCQYQSFAWPIAIVIAKLGLLILGIYFSVQGRNAWPKFNESKSTGLSIYNYTFSTLILLLVQFAVSDVQLSYIVTSIVTLYNATLLIIVNMLFKVGGQTEGESQNKGNLSSILGGPNAKGVKMVSSPSNSPSTPVGNAKSGVSNFKSATSASSQ